MGVVILAVGALFSIVMYWTGRLIMCVIRHPIIFGTLFVTVFLVDSCTTHFNVGAIDGPKLLNTVGEHEVVTVLGREPENCSNDDGVVTCSYDGVGTVLMSDDHVKAFVFTRLNGEDFRLNEKFYRRVLGMLKIPYRAPDSATIDAVHWTIPNVGTVTASSDKDLTVNWIALRG